MRARMTMLGAGLLLAAVPVLAQSTADPRDRKIAPADMKGNHIGRVWWQALYQCWSWHHTARPEFTGTPADKVKAKPFGTAARAQLMRDRSLSLEAIEPITNDYIADFLWQDVAKRHDSFKKLAALQDQPESTSALYFDTYCDQLLAAHGKLS